MRKFIHSNPIFSGKYEVNKGTRTFGEIENIGKEVLKAGN